MTPTQSLRKNDFRCRWEKTLALDRAVIVEPAFNTKSSNSFHAEVRGHSALPTAATSSRLT